MGTIKEYGLAGAIREYFARRAEARKPPLTQDEQTRKAIDDIIAFASGPSQLKAGRYIVQKRNCHYDGERSTFYTAEYNGTLLWRGTYYGPYNPFHGEWLIKGPWIEDMLNTLMCHAALLKSEFESKIEADILRQEQEYQDELIAAEKRRLELVDQFNRGE